jgi:hypothetical protein
LVSSDKLLIIRPSASLFQSREKGRADSFASSRFSFAFSDEGRERETRGFQSEELLLQERAAAVISGAARSGNNPVAGKKK